MQLNVICGIAILWLNHHFYNHKSKELTKPLPVWPLPISWGMHKPFYRAGHTMWPAYSHSLQWPTFLLPTRLPCLEARHKALEPNSNMPSSRKPFMIFTNRGACSLQHMSYCRIFLTLHCFVSMSVFFTWLWAPTGLCKDHISLHLQQLGLGYLGL